MVYEIASEKLVLNAVRWVEFAFPGSLAALGSGSVTLDGYSLKKMVIWGTFGRIDGGSTHGAFETLWIHCNHIRIDRVVGELR